VSDGSGFGRNFSRDVEAVLGTVQLGVAVNEVYLYPHEVRENLRIAGMRLDRALKPLEVPDPFNLPPTHEPDFGDPPEDPEEYTDPEEDVND
jgi:hypothetical protein